MGEKSKITDKDFKVGDTVLVIGTYVGHPEYSDDAIISFDADPSVTLPQSHVKAGDVINLKKSRLPEEHVIRLLKMIFSEYLEEKSNNEYVNNPKITEYFQQWVCNCINNYELNKLVSPIVAIDCEDKTYYVRKSTVPYNYSMVNSSQLGVTQGRTLLKFFFEEGKFIKFTEAE